MPITSIAYAKYYAKKHDELLEKQRERYSDEVKDHKKNYYIENKDEIKQKTLERYQIKKSIRNETLLKDLLKKNIPNETRHKINELLKDDDYKTISKKIITKLEATVIPAVVENELEFKIN
jgi:hypothetical protein